MKKEINFRAVFGRVNLFKWYIISATFVVCSYPRLLLEVLIRKNFGERYFNLASVITAAAIVAYIPYNIDGKYLHGHFLEFMQMNFLWYAYLAVFIICSIRRWKEIRRNPSVFDFKKYSLYQGDISKAFLSNWKQVRPRNIRFIEIVLEPLPFFLVGLALLLFGDLLGLLLVVCSICYSLSYWSAYQLGDEKIMNLIDDEIVSGVLENVMVHETKADKAKGVRIFGQLPQDPALRQILADKIKNKMDDDDDDSGVAV